MESVSAATAINISTNGSAVSETASKEQQDLSHDNHQQQQHQQQSASKTVCYLANGSTVDRLNLVLPLTAPVSTTQPPLIFSPTSQLPQLNNSNNSTTTDYYYSSDVDRTPVNTATDRKERIFSFSSCRTVDSGTESLCSGDGPMLSDAHSSASDSVTADLAADRILKFFAAEDSKSNRAFAAATGGHQRIRRRPTAANIRQTSTDPDDGDGEDDGEEEEDDEDVYSDSSTLSESSVNSPSAEFAPTAAVASSLITPESVVAAIDAKIRQREALAAVAAAVQQNRSTMATADKTTACDDAAAKETVILGTAQVANKSSADLLKAEEEEDYLDNEDAEEDEDDCPPVRLIRSTSLKTGKTPPGTPCGKKIVRFADALGLDLESVRHIVDDGKPYMPPLAAFKGLTLDDEDKRWLFGSGGGGGSGGGVGIGGGNSGGACSATAAEFGAPSPTGSAPSSSHLLTTPHLRLLFVQPSSDPGPFLERVRSQRVCLENCLVSGPSGPTDLFTVTAIVRVLNVGFEKSLLLRYTTNEWLTWTDVVAGYVAGSCDGFSDKFSAAFHVAVNSNGHQSMMPGQRLLFALRYAASGGQEFWDNNLGMNYALIYQRS